MGGFPELRNASFSAERLNISDALRLGEPLSADWRSETP